MASLATIKDSETQPSRRLVLAVLLVAAFMILLDSSIVNVAVPSIQAHLSASNAAVEWVISGYALAFGFALIPGGRLGDRYGRKLVFLASLAGFTIASLLCGTARGSQDLVAWRVVQGAAAGALNPQILAMIQVAFSGPDRARAFGVYGAVTGIAAALGPLVAGLLIAANLLGLEWRPIFLVNVPIGLAAGLLAVRWLPESRGQGGSIDVIGIVLVALAIGTLTYPLVEGPGAHWPVWSVLALTAVLPALGLFAVWELWCIQRGRTPLVDVRIFTNRAFAVGIGIGMSFFASFTAAIFVLSFYLQAGLGRTALEAGLTIAPYAIGSFVGASASDRIARRLGYRVLQLGTGLMLIGLAIVLVTIRTAGPQVSDALIAPPLLLAGLGSGLVIAPNVAIVLARVSRRHAGAAGGTLIAAQRIGTAIGIAGVGIVLFGALSVGAATAAQQAGSQFERRLSADRVSGFDAQTQVLRFERCFEERVSSIVSKSAPDCAELLDGSFGVDFSAAERSALANDYTVAVQAALGGTMAILAVTFLLIQALPKNQERRDPELAEPQTQSSDELSA